MGRRDRERIERIRRGDEQSIASKLLDSRIGRTAVRLASRQKIVDTLTEAPTEEQIEVLGSISPSKVGKAIMKKAPAEMDKGIRIFRNQGRTVTVDGLLEEARNTPGFLSMCENAGVPYAWFENLARERMKKHGIVEG